MFNDHCDVSDLWVFLLQQTDKNYDDDDDDDDEILVFWLQQHGH